MFSSLYLDISRGDIPQEKLREFGLWCISVLGEEAYQREKQKILSEEKFMQLGIQPSYVLYRDLAREVLHRWDVEAQEKLYAEFLRITGDKTKSSSSESHG